MRIALTGTPGTGKSTVARLVGGGFEVIDVNALIKGSYNLGIDDQRSSVIADIDRLSKHVRHLQGNVLLEGHVAHLLPVDKIIVLRAHPELLRKRLEQRGWSERKIMENLDAEALDVILVEAVNACNDVSEIDTSGKTPEQVAKSICEIIAGTDKYLPGMIDFSEAYYQ